MISNIGKTTHKSVFWLITAVIVANPLNADEPDKWLITYDLGFVLSATSQKDKKEKRDGQVIDLGFHMTFIRTTGWGGRYSWVFSVIGETTRQDEYYNGNQKKQKIYQDGHIFDFLYFPMQQFNFYFVGGGGYYDRMLKKNNPYYGKNDSDRYEEKVGKFLPRVGLGYGFHRRFNAELLYTPGNFSQIQVSLIHRTATPMY